MSADDSFPMDQISSLFPQLENIQLVGAKGPQQIFTATLKSNFAPVMLRVVPTEEAGIFGWDPSAPSPSWNNPTRGSCAFMK